MLQNEVGLGLRSRCSSRFHPSKHSHRFDQIHRHIDRWRKFLGIWKKRRIYPQHGGPLHHHMPRFRNCNLFLPQKAYCLAHSHVWRFHNNFWGPHTGWPDWFQLQNGARILGVLCVNLFALSCGHYDPAASGIWQVSWSRCWAQGERVASRRLTNQLYQASEEREEISGTSSSFSLTCTALPTLLQATHVSVSPAPPAMGVSILQHTLLGFMRCFFFLD